MGVSTTHKAVIKAALEAVVYWMPTVWVMKLPQINSPSVMPLYTVRRVRTLSLLAAKGVIMKGYKKPHPHQIQRGQYCYQDFQHRKSPAPDQRHQHQSRSAFRGLILPTPLNPKPSSSLIPEAAQAALVYHQISILGDMGRQAAVSQEANHHPAEAVPGELYLESCYRSYRCSSQPPVHHRARSGRCRRSTPGAPR